MDTLFQIPKELFVNCLKNQCSLDIIRGKRKSIALCLPLMVVCPGGQMGEFVWVLINDMKVYSKKWCFGWNSRWEPQVIRQTRHDIFQPFDIRLVEREKSFNIHLSNSWVVIMIHWTKKTSTIIRILPIWQKLKDFFRILDESCKSFYEQNMTSYNLLTVAELKRKRL